MYVPQVTIVPPSGLGLSSVVVGRSISFAGGGYGYLLGSLRANPARLEGESRSMPRAWGGMGGSRSPGVRELTLTGKILARNFDEANRLWSRLLATCYGHEEPVRLRVTRDGVPTQIECWLSGEPEVTPAGTLNDLNFNLHFVADDPRFYATSQSSATITTGGVVCVNAGDAETFPAFTVEGPSSGTITAFTVRNETTGEKMELSGISVGSGQTLIIVMKPGFERLQRGGASYFNNRSADSVFWGLRGGQSGGGTNTVSYTATGATPTSVTATWRSAWSS